MSAPILPGERVIVVEVGDPGPQVVQVGADSAAVPVFVPGTAVGAADSFVVEHTQDPAQSVWTVAHQHGVPVAWSLRTAAGDLGWNYLVEPLDETHTRVAMDDPTAGTIRILMRRA